MLNAEAMDPREYEQIMGFVKLWAGRKGGLGEDKRIDAVIWGYGVGEVLDPLLLSSTPTSSSPLEEGERPGFFRFAGEEEKARFSFFTLFLPQILQSTSTSSRSIRLINLIHPLYPAGYKTSSLLRPTPPPSAGATSASSNPTTPPPSAPLSEAVRLSHHAIRSIVFSSHFQRILDALALKGENLEDVPNPENGEWMASRDQDGHDQGEVEGETKKIKERHSTIQVVSVAAGFHFGSVLRPFLIKQSNGSLFVQTLYVFPTSALRFVFHY